MATMEQLERALRNADKAGDVSAARRLAQEIQNMRRAEAEATSPQSSFDQLPWYGKAAQAADDTARMLANAFTLGYADKIASALGGTPLKEERILTQEARDRAGGAAVANDVIGLLAPASLASKVVGAAAPALQGSRLLPTLGRETVAGGLMGGGMAMGNDTDLGTGVATGAIGGALGTAVGRAIGAGVDKVASKLGVGRGTLAANRTPPLSVDEMAARKNAAYQALDEAGIQYDPGDVRNMVDEMRKGLAAADADKELHRTAVRRMQRLANRVGGRTKRPTSLSEIDTQRQLIARDVKEPAMGGIMRDTLDRFVETTRPRNATTAEARNMIKSAREANRKLMNRQAVESALSKTRNAANDGTVGPFRSLLNKGKRGWTDEEYAALQRIVTGESWDEMLARKAVDATARMGSFGSGATAGAVLGGPGGAVVGGLGALAAPPLAKGALRHYRDANIESLINMLGDGSISPSALQELVNRTAGGVGAGVLFNEAEERRRRKRD